MVTCPHNMLAFVHPITSCVYRCQREQMGELFAHNVEYLGEPKLGRLAVDTGRYCILLLCRRLPWEHVRSVGPFQTMTSGRYTCNVKVTFLPSLLGGEGKEDRPHSIRPG